MTTQYVDTSLLRIAYEEHGSADGTPAILVHGFPDDARSWDSVAAALAQAEYRCIAPYLRGFGPTRFHEAGTMRSGQTGAIAQDIVALADALELERFVLVGHDWGANAAQAIAALHPERVQHLVSFAPYSLTWDDFQGSPDYPQLRALWYQNVLQGALGENLLRYDRERFCRFLWSSWSPNWASGDDTFRATAASFSKPDFDAVVLHAYRSGYDNAPNDPRYAAIEAQLAQRPPIEVATTVLLGRDDGIALFRPWMVEQQRDFRGDYAARVYDGVGHFIHRERPDAVIEAIHQGAQR